MAQPEHHDYDGITEDREQRPPAYFTVLFYGLIVWGVAFSAFYLLSGWSSDAEFQAKLKAHETRGQGVIAVPAATATAAVKPAEPAPAPPPAPQPADAPAAVAAVPATAAKSDAKALFAEKCAMCHGADAKGGFGPNLTAKDYEYGKTRQAIFLSISQGRANNKMPAFEAQLKREEIYALADYLLTLK
jgi:cytochrome c oxidase cbb3-type subunit 3